MAISKCKVSIPYLDDVGHEQFCVGTANTVALATTEAQKKSALIGGTSNGAAHVSYTDDGITGSFNDPTNGSTDAYITIKKAGVGKKPILVQDVSNDWRDGQGGIVLTTQQAIDFAASYVDGTGNTGYVFVKGKYK